MQLLSIIMMEAEPEKLNEVEVWKAARHGLDIRPDIEQWAAEARGHAGIPTPDLHRMKWHGVFWRKPDKDRFMVRIRVTAGELTSAQARALAFLAYESDHGVADLTTRGNIQIQGFRLAKIPAVLAAIERIGLTAKQTGFDNVRTVTSHPFAGIDPEEIIDTRPLAREITGRFLDSRALADLPRKFNIALNGRPDSLPSDWTQDAAWLAARNPAGEAGFRLVLGGRQGASPRRGVPAAIFARPEEVADLAIALIEVFRARGSRSAPRTRVRFGHLIERLGVTGVIAEVEERLGRRLVRWEEPPPPPRTPHTSGWFTQTEDGLQAACVAAPFGRLTWRQLEGLSIVARELGGGALRIAAEQNVIIPDVKTRDRDEVGHVLAGDGLAIETDPLARNVTVCTGRQFCNMAVTESKKHAFLLVEELRRRRVETYGIRFAMSGCPHACAQHHTADIGLCGGKTRRGIRIVDAYDILLGGGESGGPASLGTLYRKAVPFTTLAEQIEEIVAEFRERRITGETFSAYWRRRLASAPPETAASTESACWLCEACGFLITGARAPVYCPCCASVRTRFRTAPLLLPNPNGDALDKID